MKKSLKLFLLAIVLLTPNITHAESACSYEEQVEINNIVSHVNATYETVDIFEGTTLDIDNRNEDGTIPRIDNYIKGFNINIMNITEDIYVVVSNNVNSEIKTFYYKDTTDGEVSFQVRDATSLVTYTIEIHSNKYSCIGDVFRKFAITTPIYNDLSGLAACEGNEGFYYCQEYINSENISVNEFMKRIKEYKEEKQEEEEKKESEKSFWKNNKTTIIVISGVVVLTGVATTVILLKKKRSRVL